MDPGATEIDWTNKLNKYKDKFALSTEDFKKFAITQDDKVSGKDKEIVQLLKTDASIVCIFRRTIELHNWLQLRVHKHRSAKRLALTTEQNEVAKEMLIEQECGCQDYGLMEITNKMSNLELEKQSRIQKLEKKIEEKTNMSRYLPSLTITPTQYRLIWAQCKPRGETQYKNTVHTFMLWDIPSEASPGQAMIQNVNPYSKRIKVVEKEKDGGNIDTSILAIISQILTRLNKLEERQETKDRKGAVEPKIKGSNTEVAITIDNTSE
ncbi:12024_t:CDS:2, partial [Gigaspora rosea]